MWIDEIERLQKALKRFEIPQAILDSASQAQALTQTITRFSQIRIPTVFPEIQRLAVSADEQLRATATVIQKLVSDVQAISQLVAPLYGLYNSIDHWFQEHQQVFSGLAALIAEFAHKQELIDAFRGCNLWVCPSMSEELLEKVVDLQQQGKGRVVLLMVNNYYRRNNHENLRRTVESWRTNPYFSSRMRIFEQALEAHIKGNYALTMPTLFAQAEGIASEYVHRNGLPARLGKTQEVITEAIENSFTFSEMAIVDTLLAYVINSGYTYTDFTVEITKKKRATTRHTVLHGIQPNYHSQTNSLRAFLLLDALSILKDV
jgi:hypothetical protein